MKKTVFSQSFCLVLKKDLYMRHEKVNENLIRKKSVFLLFFSYKTALGSSWGGDHIYIYMCVCVLYMYVPM